MKGNRARFLKFWETWDKTEQSNIDCRWNYSQHSDSVSQVLRNISQGWWGVGTPGQDDPQCPALASPYASFGHFLFLSCRMHLDHPSKDPDSSVISLFAMPAILLLIWTFYLKGTACDMIILLFEYTETVELLW